MDAPEPSKLRLGPDLGYPPPDPPFKTTVHRGGGVYRDPQNALRNLWTAPDDNEGPFINYVIADREGGVWPKDYNIT